MLLRDLGPSKSVLAATLLNHGIREPFHGVKIEDMKKIVNTRANNSDHGRRDLLWLAAPASAPSPWASSFRAGTTHARRRAFAS